MSNEYIRGSFIFGKSCDHCSAFGITCSENGLLLSEGRVGQIVVDIDRIGLLKVPGKLQDCKIAAGRTPRKDGTDQIREEAINKIKDDTRVYEEIAESNLNNWSQSK